MSYRLPSLRVGCVLAALACSGLSVCTVQAGGKERGRSIEFSEPKSDEVTTNLHQLTSRKDSLKQLEEDLSKSLRPFSSRSSLDGVPQAPPRQPTGPVVPSKRAKELLERRKNYPFMRPEDLLKEPTVEEVLKVPEYGPDGQEKQKVSALEQYYHRLDAKRAANRKIGQVTDEALYGTPGKSKPAGNPVVHYELNMPADVKESEQALKKLFGSDSTDSGSLVAPKRNPYSDIFGLGEERGKSKQSLWDLGGGSDPSRPAIFGADGIGSLAGSSDATPAPAYSPPALSGSPPAKRPEAPDAQLGAINPVFVPIGPPDVNAKMLGQTSLKPAPLKTEPAKPTVSAPAFSAPRRPFN
jgi:hypothetical protein